jgi:hypothetical protein
MKTGDIIARKHRHYIVLRVYFYRNAPYLGYVELLHIRRDGITTGNTKTEGYLTSRGIPPGFRIVSESTSVLAAT